jgi:hypothetical protein
MDPFLGRASALFFVAGILAAACGRSSLAPSELGYEDFDAGPDVINPPDSPFDTPPPPPGDSVAPPDVLPCRGFACGDVVRPDVVEMEASPPPPSCGDGACDDGETCFTCPRDCGLCSGCPDGKCDNGKTCSSCPLDCGPCAGCGDHICEGDETCYSCPEDCGTCQGCGDGVCESNETCASCPADCGVCASCGDGTCDATETCATCPADCGPCTTKLTCAQVFECIIPCLSGDAGVPVTCASTCIVEGCNNAQAAAGRLLACAVRAGFQCGFNLGCIEMSCPAQVSECTNLPCNEM